MFRDRIAATGVRKLADCVSGIPFTRRPGRPLLRAALAMAVTIAASCGDTPSQPAPIVTPPPPVVQPPANVAPTIESITVQGSRRNQPPNFSDLTESVGVAALVRDEETAVEQLEYIWRATSGSFSGTGARVTWQAPAEAATPAKVTLTLEVVERYGGSFEHRVSRTADVRLHNSTKEVADMARQFLIDFSTTSLKDWRVIMRNFSESACPPSREYQDEREQVENHYTNFVMHAYEVGPAGVTFNFAGSCYQGVRGDACVSVPVTWESTDTRTNVRRVTRGVDHLTAAYSAADVRWWLCSSRFEGPPTLGHLFYSRGR